VTWGTLAVDSRRLAGSDNVFTLASDAETSFLEGADGIQMVDARKFSHG
jgi:hypothetical protein